MDYSPQNKLPDVSERSPASQDWLISRPARGWCHSSSHAVKQSKAKRLSGVWATRSTPRDSWKLNPQRRAPSMCTDYCGFLCYVLDCGKKIVCTFGFPNYCNSEITPERHKGAALFCKEPAGWAGWGWWSPSTRSQQAPRHLHVVPLLDAEEKTLKKCWNFVRTSYL